MMSKRLSSVDDLVNIVEDGATLAIGGWGARRKPMAFVRALARSDKKDLTVISYGGPDVGILCASGKVKRLIFGFVSLDVVPLDPFFRRWRQNGGNVLELDEGMLQWGLRAAAMNLPFLPTHVGMYTDVERHGGFKRVRSPYEGGEELLAMPALRPDVAVLHAHRADASGRVLCGGRDVYFDDLFARASKKTYVTCEKIVESCVSSDAQEAQRILMARCFIHGVVEVQMGAHPTASPPAYPWDERHIKGSYCRAAQEENGWKTYYDHFVAQPHDIYIQATS